MITQPQFHRLAVLCSGGLDSAILLAESLSQYQDVYPIYVRMGLQWEAIEFEYLEQFLAEIRADSLRMVKVIDLPIRDIYGAHWSTTGDSIPDDQSPDEAVYLPGRNVLLLAKAIIWCHIMEIPALALAPLASNPFPDATDEFFAIYGHAVNMAIQGSVKIIRPFAHLSKIQVLQRAVGMPLRYTFSCINPIKNRHCGRCNKCAERQNAFTQAGLDDPTDYAWI